MDITDRPKINEINSVIEAYFTNNPSHTMVPAKALMPAFIGAGIFAKDRKNGAPIRSILKNMDRSNELQLIPFVYAERNGEDTYWYFIPLNTPAPTAAYKQEKKKTESKNESHLNSDETYVIDLCDKIIGLKANRKKRFDFLLGDLHKDGVSQTKLPVNAYYEILHLVVHFNKTLSTEQVETVDKNDFNDEFNHDNDRPVKRTNKVISRAEKRKIYDDRRAKVLPEHDIDFVVISYSDFKCNSDHKIIRDEVYDLKIVRKALKEFITPE